MKFYSLLLILGLISTQFCHSQNGPNPHNIIYETRIIPEGDLIGYRAEKKLDFTVDDDATSDWSGIYLGNNPDVAKGYLSNNDGTNPDASLWEIYAAKDIRVHSFSGEYLERSDISGEDKANAIKILMEIPTGEKLIPFFGRSGAIYDGPHDEDGGREFIIAWSNANSSSGVIEPVKRREYQMSYGEPTRWRNDAGDSWRRIDTEPARIDPLRRRNSAHRTKTIRRS